MQHVTKRALQPALWLGLLAGWTLSGLVVVTVAANGWIALVAFFFGFLAVAGLVYDRHQRRDQWSDLNPPPGPWDGLAWEGWLVLASRVITALVLVRIVAAVPWAEEWTHILWRIDA